MKVWIGNLMTSLCNHYRLYWFSSLSIFLLIIDVWSSWGRDILIWHYHWFPFYCAFTPTLIHQNQIWMIQLVSFKSISDDLCNACKNLIWLESDFRYPSPHFSLSAKKKTGEWLRCLLYINMQRSLPIWKTYIFIKY